jgi:hypothetical protein
MIKALGAAKGGGGRVLILGLSDENWARLRTGSQPIPIRLQDLDPSLPPLTIVLTGGPDEDSIFEDLRANVKINAVHQSTEEPP